jgi:hypothetical protein
MSGRQHLDPVATVEQEDEGTALLRQLVEIPEQQTDRGASVLPSVVVGELVAMSDDGVTPLVLLAQQSGARVRRARTVIDLHGAHIGAQVVLAFERGDPDLPIVMGVLRGARGMVDQQEAARALDVESDGQRMVVSATEQLVLRCGKASITLTRAGKLLIEGTYVLSRSTGVNRIKGGSVQLN